MHMKKQDENNIVAKGNELIEGISDLELLDFKLLNLVISKINSVSDTELRTYTLSKREVMDYLNLRNNYGKLDKLIKSIPYKKVIINTIDKYKTCYWFHATVSKSQIEFKIDANLKPYLIRLTTDFTQYELKNTNKFRSKYSFKFYEWFLMKYNKNKLYKSEVKLILSLDKIKNDLFLSDVYSKNFNYLKVRVLEPSLNDINNYTDLIIEYEKINESRKIVALEFLIKLKKVLTDENDSENRVNSENIDSSQEEFEVKKSAKEFFDKVWSLYPLRKGKADIKINDMMKLQKLGYEVMKTCIERYSGYLSEKEKEGFNHGIQNGHRFFTKGYIDYLDENYTPYKAKPKKANNNNKPVQATNFPQRDMSHLTDEDWDKFYDNFK